MTHICKSASGTARSCFYSHHYNFIFIGLSAVSVPGEMTQNTEQKVQVIVDEEDLRKLRIYFDGSSWEKVPLSSTCMIILFSTFSCLIPVV